MTKIQILVLVLQTVLWIPTLQLPIPIGLFTVSCSCPTITLYPSIFFHTPRSKYMFQCWLLSQIKAGISDWLGSLQIQLTITLTWAGRCCFPLTGTSLHFPRWDRMETSPGRVCGAFAEILVSFRLIIAEGGRTGASLLESLFFYLR